jgi:hypothetical protein
MTANDYREFTERLKRDYPDESFLCCVSAITSRRSRKS